MLASIVSRCSQLRLAQCSLINQLHHHHHQQQQQCASLSTDLRYTWDNDRSRGGVGGNRNQSSADAKAHLDHNEIRMRGSISHVVLATDKFCKFRLRTKHLYQRSANDGSRLWVQGFSDHTVISTQAALKSALANCSVGARVDIGGVLNYGNLDAESADAGTKPAIVKLMWIRPVVDEEAVELSFALPGAGADRGGRRRAGRQQQQQQQWQQQQEQQQQPAAV